MEIRPNTITALVGLSGAGKSTLISLLDKFYEPQEGQIKLDGIDLKIMTLNICVIILDWYYRKTIFSRARFLTISVMAKPMPVWMK